MNMHLTTGGAARPAYGEAWRATLIEQAVRNDAAEAQPAKPTASKFVWTHRVGALVALVVGTGGAFTADYVSERDDRGYRLPDFRYGALRAATRDSKPQVRSSAENVARIREVFKPSVTELASLFGVSRQAIYNWQAGQPIAEPNEDRMEQLARAADLLDSEGFADKSSVLRRKLPGGKTLFEAVRAGESADAAAAKLIALVNRELEQRQALSARLANRTRKPVDANDIGSPYLDERG